MKRYSGVVLYVLSIIQTWFLKTQVWIHLQWIGWTLPKGSRLWLNPHHLAEDKCWILHLFKLRDPIKVPFRHACIQIWGPIYTFQVYCRIRVASNIVVPMMTGKLQNSALNCQDLVSGESNLMLTRYRSPNIGGCRTKHRPEKADPKGDLVEQFKSQVIGV